MPRRAWLPVVAFTVLFALGNDFWAWGRVPRLVGGLPLWVWYYVALGVVLAVTYALLWREPLAVRDVAAPIGGEAGRSGGSGRRA